MLGTCDRCRSPLDVDINAGGYRGGPEASALQGDSYVLLPERRRSLALPDLSQTLADVSGSGFAPASTHELLRTKSRLLELSELLHDKAPSTGCGVPLCEDCATTVLNDLQQRLAQAHAEGERLRAGAADLLAGEDLEDLPDDDDGSSGAPAQTSGKSARRDDVLSAEEFAREREAQREEEARMRAALASASQERAALTDELARLKEEWAAQQAAEEERHAAINKASLARQDAAEEAMRAVQLVAVSEREIARLREVDVLSDVFTIDLDAPIATINGLRLGRQSGVTVVEWSELNAALGQVVLLLHTLARLHLPGGAFATHVLVPHGSMCRVHSKKEPAKVYELYGTGSRVGSFFGGNARLDRAQSMLLACVMEIIAHAAAHFSPRATRVAPQPPHSLADLGSLVGSSSAVEGKKLLAVLAWCLQWSKAARAPTSG